MVGHVRALTYPDWQGGGPLKAVFYAATSLGSGAVIVFFALSGYWVGGPLWIKYKSGTINFTSYVSARLARLWSVLLPALALTSFVVSCGVLFFPRSSYYIPGAFHDVAANPQNLSSGSTLIGNMFFTQGILVEEYGGNGPLWSLAYEFWFYAFFPVLIGVLLVRKGWKLLVIFAALAIAWFVGIVIVGYMLIWLLGAATYVGAGRFPASSLGSAPLAVLRLAMAGFLGLSLAAGVLPGTQGSYAGDLFIGAAACGVIFAFHGYHAVGNGLVARAAVGLAAFSYSLYAIHVPLSQFLAALMASAGVNAFLSLLSICCLDLLIAVLFYWIFERNHLILRTMVKSNLDLISSKGFRSRRVVDLNV